MQQGDVVAGRFVADRYVGEGGGGVVWRAVDRLSGGAVALKLVRVSDHDTPERFVREASAIASLQHPAIVRYVAHGMGEMGSYLATEWVEGETLAERHMRAPLDVRESIIVVRRIAEALGVAHARGIVHRDVKPSNVVLRDCDIEQPTLLDFGVVHLGRQVGVTLPGAILGTPSYMSPEQACGESNIDASTDVFALGCVLFRCLTGHTPFAGDGGLAVLGKVVLQPAPRVSEVLPDVPGALDLLVARMLEKDRSLRPADGAQVAAELAALEQGSPGAAIAPPPRASSLSHAEQGIVTIVIVAPRKAGANDETVRVKPLGGRLERLLDGSYLAVFRGRGNATDQAAQAAHFAIHTRTNIPDARIVLATGRGVISDRVPVGDAIDRAARLIQHARANAVLLDDTSAALLDARFEVVRDAHETRLVDERADDELTRTLLGKSTACVGREHELDGIVRTLNDCVEQRAARAVLVTGASGIGKSRLRGELLRTVKGACILVGSGDPVGAGSPFALIGQAIRRAVGILDGEPMSVSHERIEQRVLLHVPERDRPRIAEFLGELVGVPFSDAHSEPLRSARRDPSVMSDQMRSAWEDWLRAECHAHPVLIVLDDLHWGDAPSVAFIDAALRVLDDCSLMVVAFARPDVMDLFPALWSERRTEHVRLGPLGGRAAQRLVQGVLGESVDRTTMTRIVERAAGNPLYLEELIRAVSEGQDALPETVLAMVHARLLKLDPGARHVLRAASVFGETFWVSGVRALLGPEQPTPVEQWIDVLAHQELIARHRDARFSNEREYGFRHSIVRDGAYAMLTDADSALGHQLAGDWLASKGERDAALLADHFERGRDQKQAVSFNVLAARQALQANDVATAVSRAARAESLGASGVDLGRLRVVQAAVHGWQARAAEAMSLGMEAMQLLPLGSLEWCHAAGNVTREAGRVGDIARVESIAQTLAAMDVDEGVVLARASALATAAIRLHMAGRSERAMAIGALASSVSHDDSFLRGQLATLRGLHAHLSSDLREAADHAVAAADAYERAGVLRAACAARSDLGNAYMLLGMWERAEDVLRGVLATCERVGLIAIAPGVQSILALVMARQGRVAEALPLVQKALDGFARGPNPRTEGGARVYFATILALANDLDGAAREARMADDLFATIPQMKPFALATLARINVARGLSDEALAPAREAMKLLESLGRLGDGESIVRLAWAEALDVSGQRNEARHAIAQARDALLAVAAKIGDEPTRSAFLAIPEHARTLALASQWF